MSKRTDTSENFRVTDTLTLKGPGNLEAEGTVYTDLIRANTISSTPVDLEQVEFLSKIMTLNENSGAPSAPAASKFSFYIDSGIFKSINNGSTVTTYQPTTIKGDLLTHNGTTQIRLPVSTNTYVLTGNSAETSGLKWERGGKETYVFYEEQTSGTTGGTATTGTWTKITLNTSQVYPSGSTNITISSSVLTVAAGTYHVVGSKSFVGVDEVKTRLRNTTAGSTLALSSSEDAMATTGTAKCIIDTIITLGTSSSVEFQYYCTTSTGTSDLGAAVNDGEAEHFGNLSFVLLE